MFGWSVNIKAIQEEQFVCIWVDSFISCWKLSADVCQINLVSSVVLMLLDHQEDDLALRSPAITDKYGLKYFFC